MGTVPGAVSGMVLKFAMPSVMPGVSHVAIRCGTVAGIVHVGTMLGTMTSMVLMPATLSVMPDVSHVAVRCGIVAGMVHMSTTLGTVTRMVLVPAVPGIRLYLSQLVVRCSVMAGTVRMGVLPSIFTSVHCVVMLMIVHYVGISLLHGAFASRAPTALFYQVALPKSQSFQSLPRRAIR